MTDTTATRAIRVLLGAESRMAPRPGHDCVEPPEASPLWPLVLVLAEIAARVEREQAAESAGTTVTDEPVHGAA